MVRLGGKFARVVLTLHQWKTNGNGCGSLQCVGRSESYQRGVKLVELLYIARLNIPIDIAIEQQEAYVVG